MATANVNGLTLGYEVIGDGAGRPWSITPGGRFTKESPGVRQFAEVLAGQGHRVLIWDRPNCGESDVCFEGSSESAMQADALVALLEHLDMTPAVISGGSGGARVSLLAASRHPEAAAGVAVWWISGGVYGLLSLAMHYCGGSLGEAWRDGMEAVAAHAGMGRGDRAEPVEPPALSRPGPGQFIATMERWMVAYCVRDGEHIPGLPDADARAMDIPALVFRSGKSDPHHTRATSEALASMLPQARLVEPPWGTASGSSDRRPGTRGCSRAGLCWHLSYLEWQASTLG